MGTRTPSGVGSKSVHRSSSGPSGPTKRTSKVQEGGAVGYHSALMLIQQLAYRAHNFAGDGISHPQRHTSNEAQNESLYTICKIAEEAT